MEYPSKQEMWERGITRAAAFCIENSLPLPHFVPTDDKDWRLGTCAYYRMTPDGFGKVVGCIKKMAHIGTAGPAWSYPGYIADRTPYGVIAHEIGHHVDYQRAKDPETRHAYFSDFGVSIRAASREPAITSYAPNDQEWFAEMMRLFITNPTLLLDIRPNTYNLLRASGLKPVETRHWKEVLEGAPARTMQQAMKKTGVSA